MRDFRDDPAAPNSLVEPDRVRRELYASEELYALKLERLFARTWLYVGHASQVPAAGDYITVDLAGRPVLLVRGLDGALTVLANRCAHKGSMIASAPAGNTGRALRCPYHGWSYRLDGSLLATPVKDGYDGTAMRESATGAGLTVIASATHRGFVFARLAPTGPAFADFFGPLLASLDAMADRSPEGELEVAGPPLRNVIACNWKVYLENINDSLHANVTHASAAGAALEVWERRGGDRSRPMAIEQLAPFTADDQFFVRMGGRVYANGHSLLGTNLSVHSAYAALGEYEQAMERAYGEERARAILAYNPQNAVLYPSIALKASPQTMRVIRPLGVERTLIETWAFRAKGAPAALLQRTELYNRLVFSPMSVVAHDDIHVFETIQRTLRTSANPWVSLHREHRADEFTGDSENGVESSGASEILMRNQYRAWLKWMQPDG